MCEEITRYEIGQLGNTFFIFGSFPIDAMQMLERMAPKHSVIDTDLARMTGATIAVGPAKEAAKLKERFGEAAHKKEANKPQNTGLSDNAVRWLATGERGLSSVCMFAYLSAENPLRENLKDKTYHPHDPIDLRRCMLMLEQVPELKPKIKMMSYVSSQWAALVNVWDILEEMMEDEAPDWRKPNCRGSAPRTYEYMKTVLKPFDR